MLMACPEQQNLIKRLDLDSYRCFQGQRIHTPAHVHGRNAIYQLCFDFYVWVYTTGLSWTWSWINIYVIYALKGATLGCNQTTRNKISRCNNGYTRTEVSPHKCHQSRTIYNYDHSHGGPTISTISLCTTNNILYVICAGMGWNQSK